MFKILICEDYKEMSRKAFQIFKEVIDEKPDAVFGLATGSSPIGLYELIVKDHQMNKTSYKDVVTFNLDEYLGIPEDHSQSYHTFMHEKLFSGIDIKKENIHIPSTIGNPEENMKQYDEALSHYNLDIQLLGVGTNGHIGFNEPGTPFDSQTHIVDLSKKTREDNARFFDGDIKQVPTQAITMGIGTIMTKAKKIVLLASGEKKKDAIYGMIKGPLTESLPASILQTHPDVIVILDPAAASRL